MSSRFDKQDQLAGPLAMAADPPRFDKLTTLPAGNPLGWPLIRQGLTYQTPLEVWNGNGFSSQLIHFF